MPNTQALTTIEIYNNYYLQYSNISQKFQPETVTVLRKKQWIPGFTQTDSTDYQPVNK